MRGKFQDGRLVFHCTCGLATSKLHVCRHIIRVVYSIFCKHMLDISFVHMRTMRLWYNFAVTGGADAKLVPSNWDALMQQICVPSVIMPTACWTAYNTRCPVEAAPEAESYVELEADYEGGDGGGDDMSDTGRGDVEWQQQARNLVLQMLEACGRDVHMKRQVLDHLETVVRDVQLMVEQTSGATRASGARIRPFYDH